MEKLVIKGGNKLKGEVEINGAKNAAVAIIPATLLASDRCVVNNIPNIRDTRLFIKILKEMGVDCTFENNTLTVEGTNMESCIFDMDEMTEMRGSYYFAGALLGKYKHINLPLPGGCNLGSRPIDLHLKAFERLGAEIKIEHGKIIANADKLVGTNIYFDVVSVGATINTMLASVYAEGETTLENSAKEPHVVDVADFLNKMGAKIEGAGTDTIKITGVETLAGCTHDVVPDQIEAGTYMVAAAITEGDVVIKNVVPKHLEAIVAKMKEANVGIIESENSVRVIGSKDIKAIDLRTSPYPGFPTDMQSQMGTMLTLAKGASVITETIWANRFRYTEELRRMGAKIKADCKVAVFKGVDRLTGAKVTAPDLRGGVALVLAGLVAEGETEVTEIDHIDRGYESIENTLQKIGADIRRVAVEA